MPDNRSKRPVPAVMDVGTFRERFGTDEGCWEHLGAEAGAVRLP